MSVRDAILGVLSLGSAYGHQLLFELKARLPHRNGINPGQVYSTLSRLRGAGLVAEAGTSTDNLPLYALTESGRLEVDEWLTLGRHVDLNDWSDLGDLVLMSASLPSARPLELITRMRSQLSDPSQDDETGSRPKKVSPAVSAIDLARAHHRRAVIAWLADIEALIESGALVARGFENNRPGRGRKSPSGEAPPRG